MTVAVAGHWELSWNTPIKEAELWNLPLRDFDVSEWWMWPVSGIRHNESKVNLHERRNLETILGENDGRRVFLEPENPLRPHGGVDLRTFEHPDDALYVFGSAHFDPVASHKQPGDLVVTIPTVHNKGVLWPHQCAVIVLYDRMVKSWQ